MVRKIRTKMKITFKMCFRQCFAEGKDRSPHFTPPSVKIHLGTEGALWWNPSVTWRIKLLLQANNKICNSIITIFIFHSKLHKYLLKTKNQQVERNKIKFKLIYSYLCSSLERFSVQNSLLAASSMVFVQSFQFFINLPLFGSFFWLVMNTTCKLLNQL